MAVIVGARILLVTAVLALVGAGVPTWARAGVAGSATEEAEFTRLDRINSAHMRFNDWLLLHVVDTAARGYNWVMPKWGQRRVSALLGNLHGPRNVVNSLLQGKLKRSGTHLARFLVDSTVGVAGAFEIAEPHLGLRAPPETFSETLGVYRVGVGPFLIIPLIGESSPRRLSGSLVDTFLHPLSWISPPGLATGTSMGARTLEGVGALARRMPVPGTQRNSWATYENILAAATAAPYQERRELFFENEALDVED